MKKAIATCLLAAAIVTLALLFSGPRYQGRSAEYWIGQLRAPNLKERHEAEAAVRAIGSNVVPILVERMKAEDSQFRSNATAVLQRQNLVAVPDLPASISRAEAVRGFETLGPTDATRTALLRLLKDPATADHASAALIQMNNEVIPTLLVAITNHGLQVRRRVIFDLGARHTNAPGVADALADRLRNDPDVVTRGMAALALGNFPDASPPMIQALIEGLDNPATRAVSALALGHIGTNARAAVPALERLVRQDGFKDLTRQSLALIDPLAPARLGFTVVPVTNRYE